MLAKAVLGRALKLQIGCGAEPTLFAELNSVIKLATKFNVPYISLTTNANLIVRESLEQWVANGLNEITVSLHGVREETYHEMMGKASYKQFFEALEYITDIKQKHPKLKLRINYTFNEDNFDELKYFWEVFRNIDIDILQIRPITKIGNSLYNNFSMEKIIPVYDEVYFSLMQEAKKRNVLLIAPAKDQLINRQSSNSVLKEFTYCYISSDFFWKDDFDWRHESFDEYSKRVLWSRTLFKNIFLSSEELKSMENKTMNYNIV